MKLNWILYTKFFIFFLFFYGLMLVLILKYTKKKSLLKFKGLKRILKLLDQIIYDLGKNQVFFLKELIFLKLYF